MTARLHTTAACHRSIATDGIDDTQLAGPSVLTSIRALITAQDALDDHRLVHAWRDIDPTGDRLEDAAYEHRLHCRAILASVGIDPDRLSEVLI